MGGGPINSPIIASEDGLLSALRVGVCGYWLVTACRFTTVYNVLARRSADRFASSQNHGILKGSFL